MMFLNWIGTEWKPERLAVHVRKKALGPIREGHPWLFEDSIEKISREGKAGDIAVVFDEHKCFVAAGLYDPLSSVRVKILTNSADVPPVGSCELFDLLVENALKKRIGFLPAETDAWRVIHGDSDGFPGFVADKYCDALSLKVYSAAMLPWLKQIVCSVLKFLPEIKHLSVRLSRELQNLKEQMKFGFADGQTFSLTEQDDNWNGVQRFRENGIIFEANLSKGQKTGFFLDQRGNRARVRNLAKDKNVLNVFSYSGGFSLYAAAGGAKNVCSVDLDKHAIDDCEKNFQLNQNNSAVANCHHTSIVNDAFIAMESLRKNKMLFDLVIVDPPSFAKSKAEIAGALHSYARLARSAVKLLKSGGILVFASCSSRVENNVFFETVLHNAKAAGHPVHEFQRQFHEADHPARFAESSYLKCIYARG